MTRPPVVEERDLAPGLGAGDTAALGALYDRLGATAYALALSIVRDPRDAEEVVSDTFLQVWRGAGGYDAGRGTMRAWVLAIARSRALDRVRARDRRERALGRWAAAETGGFALPPSEPGETPGATLGRVDAARRLAGALSAIPEEQRRAIALAYFEGLTQREIAESEGLPLGTVKTRIRAGMQKLREALEDEGEE